MMDVTGFGDVTRYSVITSFSPCNMAHVTGTTSQKIRQPRTSLGALAANRWRRGGRERATPAPWVEAAFSSARKRPRIRRP